MPHFTIKKTYALFVSMAALSGCSALLEWDYEGLLCDALNPVTEGYSCLDNKAVLLNSLPLDVRCTASEQCVSGLVCAPSGAHKETCRPACNEYYANTSACGAGEYCSPEYSASNKDAIGVCTRSTPCATDADCGAEKTCVEVNTIDQNVVKTCLDRCVLETTGGVVNPRCPNASALQSTCQPLGVSAVKKLVCLNTRGTVTVQGNLCAMGGKDSVCVRGLACVGNTCKRYCDVATASSCSAAVGASLTCTQQQADPLFAVCQ
jgi:hypothetical protein